MYGIRHYALVEKTVPLSRAELRFKAADNYTDFELRKSWQKSPFGRLGVTSAQAA